MFGDLKKVALTRNVLLPVGTDYTPPNRWVTEIHRDWNARYSWPRFVCALPREFFAAVRAEIDDRGLAPSPQTRDMNPIYTGKDVSYIDTKLANRAAENAVFAAENSPCSPPVAGADYPAAALAKAWVQLSYGAHHDAITGSQSDQVYLDLLTSWRDAWELGSGARDAALPCCPYRSRRRSAVVWNPLAHSRTDVVTMRLDAPFDGRARRTPMAPVPGARRARRPHHHLAGSRRAVAGVAVLPAGCRAARPVRWKPLAGNEIANEHYRLTVDPSRGGGVSSLIHHGRQLIADGRVGNELAVYQEYAVAPARRRRAVAPGAQRDGDRLLGDGGAGQRRIQPGRTPARRGAVASETCCATPKP